jgi:hypothetical protein
MPAGPSGHHAIRARGERCGYRDIVCKAAHQRLGEYLYRELCGFLCQRKHTVAGADRSVHAWLVTRAMVMGRD